MSSTTSRAAFYKPAGGENVNVTTDLNNNLDKLDTNLSFRVVASAAARNAISPYWEGLNVRQTDTGTCWVSNGTAPISASWDQIHTAATYNSALNLSAAATGTTVFNLRVGAEANNRIQVRGDGKISWGPGSGTAVDTTLYRSGVGALTTDADLTVGDDLTVTDALTVGGATSITGNATVTGDLAVSGVGQMQYAANTTNQTVSATAMVNATNMSVPVVANATYVFRCDLTTSGTAAGDIRFGFTMPTGAVLDYGGIGLDTSNAGTAGSASTQAYENLSSPTSALPFGVTTSFNRVIITGQCRMSSTAGTFQLQLGQVVASGSSVLRARSFMVVTRVV
jgi:hypothetical protein